MHQESADNGEEQEKAKWSTVRYKRWNIELNDYKIRFPGGGDPSPKKMAFGDVQNTPMEGSKTIMNTGQATGVAFIVII